jgi:transcriptional regulator
VSYCAVRVMVRAVGASTGVDRALVAVAETGTVADVELAVRAYRLHDEQDRKPDERGAGRGVRVRRLGEGMVRVEAVLTEVESAELETVLRAMPDRDTPTAGDGEPAEESARADCPGDPAEARRPGGGVMAPSMCRPPGARGAPDGWQHGQMYVPPSDRTLGSDEWRAFVAAQGFGHLVAPGRNRPLPLVQPTQFLLHDDRILLHLARPNPMLDALTEHPAVVLSVAGDWTYIPSDWKVVGDEDPLFGIPTTYYAAVALTGRATVSSTDEETAEVLRLQLAGTQPDTPVVDPADHGPRLRTIRAVTIEIDGVEAKFKYGGNVDDEHRAEVVSRLRSRGGPGDLRAAEHAERRRPPR